MTRSGQGQGPGNSQFHCQVTVVTTSVIGQLQMSSLEASRLANRYRDDCWTHRDRFQSTAMVWVATAIVSGAIAIVLGAIGIVFHTLRSKRLSSNSNSNSNKFIAIPTTKYTSSQIL